MEMGPPKIELDSSNSLLQMHGSKSESNLFRSFTNGLNGGSSMQSSLNGGDQEIVLTSTFSTSDNNFQTPVRGATLFPSSRLPSSRSRFQRSSSHVGSTPTSGPRSNPFDSQISMDRLHLPTCSPSVFSIVVSPSHESTSSSSGQFWSLDQQARLFPAQISDDSPWKQDAAVSKMDPDEEDKTQEAIDLYFSRHHKITSPEDSVPISVSSLHQRSILMESVGNSPNLTAPPDKSNMHENNEQEKADSSRTSSDLDNGQCSASTQTSLSFPPILPTELEKVLAKYGLLKDTTEECCNERVIHPSASGWSRKSNSRGEEGQNLSNSTLRRKLFAGIIADNDEMVSDDDDFDYNNHVKILDDDDDDKENCESTAMIMSPGKVCFTPNAQRLPSPNKSVSFNSSP